MTQRFSMKGHYIFIILASLILGNVSTIQAFEYQGVIYDVIDAEAKTAKVSRGNVVSGDIVIPSTVSDGENEFTVIEIETRAFADCGGLTSLKMPETVTTIGTSIFRNCTDLRNAELSSNLTEIPNLTFGACSSLYEIRIPNSVSLIGSTAFKDCTSLKDFYIEDGPEPITIYTLWIKDLSIKNLYVGRELKLQQSSNLTTATNFCPNLESIILATNINVFPQKLFEDCVMLKTVSITCPITQIPDKAFSGCSSLEELSLPESVKQIGNYAFEGCAFTRFEWPSTVGDVWNGVFKGCNKLTSVYIPSNVWTISSDAFIGCSSLKEFEVEEGSKMYETEAGILFNSGKITLVCYPGGKDDEKYIIPSTVRMLGNDAFSGNTRLKSVVIPETVREIGFGTFKGCVNLESIECASVKVPSVPSYTTFEDIYNSTLIIPDGCFKEYAVAEYWPKFRNIIVGDKQVLRIESSGLVYLCDETTKEAYVLGNGNETAAEILENINGFNVIGIGGTAFSNDSESVKNFEKLSIPESVKIIGKGAFRNITFNKVSLVGNNLERIEDNAFYQCKGLETMDIKSLKYIGIEAFFSSEIQNAMIYSDVVIGEKAFNWSGIRSLAIASDISMRCFERCESLETVEIMDGVKIIGQYSFNACKTLKSISIPKSVTLVEPEAFKGCSMLESVIIEDSSVPMEFRNETFRNSPKIKNAYIGRNFSFLEKPLSGSPGYTKPSIALMNTVEEVVIGNMVTEIPDKAFTGSSNLVSLQLGAKLTSIGKDAFSGGKLTELVLPPAIESVGENAFSGNPLLQIAMGSNVKNIGENAFQGIEDITGVSITAQEPPVAADNTFNYYGCPLYVLSSSADTYKTSEQCWRLFGHEEMIEPIGLKIDGNESISVNPGDSFKLTAVIEPANVSLPYIFWESTNPDVATVDCDGNVTVHEGASLKTRASYEDNDGSCTIIAKTLYSNALIAKVGLNSIPTGVEEVEQEYISDKYRSNDIYNIHGVCIKRGATNDDIESLPAGIYIINGKKVLKNK